MRFLFFILFLASFTASANPDSSQFAAMAQELDYILTKIEEREQMGVQETTYVHMRPSFNTKLADLAKNKTPISEQAIKEADVFLYQLDTMGRKTIMFYTYMFYSEKNNNDFDYKTTIEKTFDQLFATRNGTGKINVLINIMIYNQKLTDRADQYSFNLYQDKMRQSYELEDGLEKAVHAELSKEIKNKSVNTMSKNCNKALVFRAKLLLEKVKVWKKSTGMLNAGILKDIFPNTPEKRRREVANAINKYQNEFGINTKGKLANFLGQIGTETGGLNKLSEGECFKEAGIKATFGKVLWRNDSYIKYCDLFVDYDCQSITTCVNSDPFMCDPELESSVLLSDLSVKPKYICSSNLSNYVYSCRMGNGSPSTGNGSKYKGIGFVHLTGKDMYKKISEKWNEKYPNDKKEFHGSDISLLKTNVDIAIKASMIYWEINNLNDLAGKPISRSNIQKISGKINAGNEDAKVSQINGFEDRVTNTEKALKALSDE